MLDLDKIALGLLVLGAICLGLVLLARRQKQLRGRKSGKVTKDKTAAKVDELIGDLVKGPVNIEVRSGSREPEPDGVDLAIADGLGNKIQGKSGLNQHSVLSNIDVVSDDN